MAAVVSGAANSRLGGSGKTTNVAAPPSPVTSTFNTATSAVNNESQDQMMRAQIEYWKTHTAHTPDQVQQKYDAYLYAQDHGIAGAHNLDQLETVFAGAVPNAAARFADNVVPKAQAQARFDAGTARAATPALPGSGETAPVSAGNFYGARAGNASSGPGFSGVPPAAPSPGLVAGSSGGGSAGGSAGGAAGGTMSAPMTPEAISAATGMSIGQIYGMMADPTQAPLVAALGNSIGQRNQNQGYVASTLTPQAANAGTAINNGIQAGQNAVTNQYGQVGALQSGYNGLVGQQTGYANQANAADASQLANYGNQLGAATGMQAGAYNNLASTYGGMSQLTPGSFTANVQAQQVQAALANYQNAALAQSNYQTAGLTTAGMKNASYEGYAPTMANIGSATASQADYQRAAAEMSSLTQADYTQARSDPNDVAAERGALGQLTGMAGGSLDTTNGAGSGGGSAAQQSALAQYSALTSPQATAKEKFLYEQQRSAQEQQEAASRAALMNDYRVRGVGGSGMELASILQSGQQNSQQRLLGDLGTQAGAVDRSMQALAGYGNLSSQMVAQGNQVNQANMANRLGAAGAQGQLASNIRGQGDSMSQFNAGAYNQNQMFNAGAANQNNQFNAGAFNTNAMFNADAYNNNRQFNANAANTVNMFNTGQYNQGQQFNANASNQAGAFNANAYNSNSQFNANAYNVNQYQNAAFANDNSQFNAGAYNANSMNNARLAEGNNEFNANAYNSNSQYNAGQTNNVNLNNAQQVNQVNMSNSTQNQIQTNFASTYAATQQQDAANRALNLANTGITVGQNYATNAGSLNTAAVAANNSTYGRNSDLTHLGESGMLNVANAGTTANNAAGQQADRLIGGAQANFGNNLAVGNAWMGAGTAGTTAVNTALGNISGDTAAKSAQALASQPGFNFLKPNTWV